MHRAYFDDELIGSYESADRAVHALALAQRWRQRYVLPEPTRCPTCGCLDRTTVCRLCGADK
jgi:hypothetical protein